MATKANVSTKTVGLDLDNTAAKFSVAMREFVSAHAGFTPAQTKKHLPEPTTYDLDPWNWKAAGFENFMDAFTTAENAGGLYANMEAHPGAAKAIRAIQDAGHRVVVITARNSRWADETNSSLQRWGVTPDEVIFSNDKHLYHTSNGGDIEIFMDDSPSHLKKFADRGIDAIAFHNEYNVDSVATARIKHWKEAPALFGI